MAATIFPTEGTVWVPRLPIIPLVIHAPGTCRVCDAYVAHLPHAAGMDGAFETTVQSANTHLRMSTVQQLITEGWSQGGEDLVRRLRDQADQLEGAAFRARDEFNRATEDHLSQVRQMQTVIHDLQAEIHVMDARVGRRDESIRQLTREVTELREELDQRRPTTSGRQERRPGTPEPRPETTRRTEDHPKTSGDSSSRQNPPPESPVEKRAESSAKKIPKLPAIMEDWDASDSDDYVDEEEEARRIRNNRTKKALKGKGKERQEAPTSRTFGTTGEAPQPPDGWPSNVDLPTNSVVGLAGQWHNFIPRGRREAGQLLAATRSNDNGAVTRVRDLITQANRDPILRAVEGIRTLLSNWRPPREQEEEMEARDLEYAMRESRDNARRQPHPSETRGAGPSRNGHQAETSRPSRGSTPRTTEPATTTATSSSRPNRAEGSLKRRAETDGRSTTAPPAKKAKLPQPNNASPTEEWVEWYRANARSRPPSIRVDRHGQPHAGDVEALHLIRRLAPSTTGGRHAWGVAASQLFSITGLYERIVRHGQYPIGAGREAMSYPRTADNVTIFDVASWFARMGYHWDEIRFLEDFAQRRRNEYEGRALEATPPFSTYPRELNDVRDEHIVHRNQLPPLPVGVHFAHGEREDVDMDDAHSGENPPNGRPPSPGETHPAAGGSGAGHS